MKVNLPVDPDDTLENFEAAADQCACEKKQVRQRQLWPRSLSREQCRQSSQRSNANVAPVQGILLNAKTSASLGLSLQSSSFGNGSFILAGPDPAEGIVHRGRMEVWEVPDTLDFDLARGFVALVTPGRLIYRSPDADCALLDEQGYWLRYQDKPVTCQNVAGSPPQLWIRFMNPDSHPTGTYLANDGSDYVTSGRGGLNPYGAEWGPIYGHTLTGLSQLFQVAAADFGLGYYAGTLTFSPRSAPTNYATSSSPSSPPVLVASTSSYWLGANRAGMGGGNSVDASSGLHRNQATDIAIRTKGLTAAITRYWHSGGDGLSTGPIYTFGPNTLRKQFGWIWNFQRELIFSANGQVCTLVKPEGGEDAFVQAPDGSWSPARADQTAKLTKYGNR